MTRRLKPLLLLAVALLAACSDSTGPTTRVAGGTCDLNGQFIEPAPSTVATFHATGLCTLKSLGKTSVVIDEFFLADGSVNNKTTHTAENGDVLESTWYSAPGQTVQTGAIATFSGIETYKSGTGRFVTVSGSSEVNGTANIDLATGSFTARYTSAGSITF